MKKSEFAEAKETVNTRCYSMHRFNFTVCIVGKGQSQTVNVSVISNNRDNAALMVPTAVCDELGYVISSHDMRIVNG